MTHEVRDTLTGHQGVVLFAASSRDGRILVTADGKDDDEAASRLPRRGAVKLWDTASGKLLASFEGQRSVVAQAYFLPDDRTLATCGVHSSVHLWNVDQRLQSYQSQGESPQPEMP